ncbi:MAG: NUDIX hydrolase [Tepidanaerobacteraceae bacterium]|jgi:ADP-ribose pyrophosphatase
MVFHETTISSTNIFSGKIINLKVDKVRLPDGRTSTREIVSHPGAVAVVAINEKKQLLMVRQFRKAVDEILIEIPAGKLEANEDIYECAQRELMEETGFYAKKIRHLVDLYTSPGFSNEIIHLFLAQELVERQLPTDDDENIQVELVDMDDAIEKTKNGYFKDAKTVAGILLSYQQLKDEL